jgi:hypothetical protein
VDRECNSLFDRKRVRTVVQNPRGRDAGEVPVAFVAVHNSATCRWPLQLTAPLMVVCFHPCARHLPDPSRAQRSALHGAAAVRKTTALSRRKEKEEKLLSFLRLKRNGIGCSAQNNQKYPPSHCTPPKQRGELGMPGSSTTANRILTSADARGPLRTALRRAAPKFGPVWRIWLADPGCLPQIPDQPTAEPSKEGPLLFPTHPSR